MLLSMTGFGNATHQSDRARIVVEIKAVNNRYLKLSTRIPDFVSSLEADIEKLIRQGMDRGSVQLNMRIHLNDGATTSGINKQMARQLVNQLNELQSELQLEKAPLTVADLLAIPNIVCESEIDPSVQESLWPEIEAALKDALQMFAGFRRKEGESMERDLVMQCQEMTRQLTEVEQFAPAVVEEYRRKLIERIQKALQNADVDISDSDVLREVALFADKCDINEEITRLKSHLQQFDNFLNSTKSLGRKLEFVGQEMFREINTIGSKANHVGIARCVVEMKACIERIREILQNVE